MVKLRSVTFSDAYDLVKQVVPGLRLPHGVQCTRQIRLKDYLLYKQSKMCSSLLIIVEFFAGRDRIPLNSIQKHHLARLFNVLGYSHDKWLCHLATPANRTWLIVQGDVYVSPPL